MFVCHQSSLVALLKAVMVLTMRPYIPIIQVKIKLHRYC